MKIKLNDIIMGVVILTIAIMIMLSLPRAVDQMFYENYDLPAESISNME